jgi:hypothetical protein
MNPNPYQSPLEVGGYAPRRKLSGLKDFLACVGAAILVHMAIQGIAHAIRIIYFQ